MSVSNFRAVVQKFISPSSRGITDVYVNTGHVMVLFWLSILKSIRSNSYSQFIAIKENSAK